MFACHIEALRGGDSCCWHRSTEIVGFKAIKWRNWPGNCNKVLVCFGFFRRLIQCYQVNHIDTLLIHFFLRKNSPLHIGWFPTQRRSENELQIITYKPSNFRQLKPSNQICGGLSAFPPSFVCAHFLFLLG